MKTIVHEKLKAAREVLGISQVFAGKESGWSQSAISLLEKGEMIYVPNKYLTFLASQRIDLNKLFDDNVTLEDFTSNPRLELGPLVQQADKCVDCAALRENQLLRENISDLRSILHGIPSGRGERYAANG